MLQKITNCIGSVYISSNKSRILASLVLFAIVISTFATRTYLDARREVTIETVTHAASNTVQTEEKEIVSPNSIVKYGTEEEKLLNNQVLFPTKTNDKYLDEKIDEIFKKILTDDMSNYEKVLAVYDYLETNFYYSSSYSESPTSFASSYDQTMVGRARGFFKTGHGSCTEYSAAFMAMMRTLGFDCYCIQGRYGYGQHTWTIIILGENKYIFDPEVDFRNWQYSGHKLSHRNFCISQNDSGYAKYSPYNEMDNIWSFNNFETA